MLEAAEEWYGCNGPYMTWPEATLPLRAAALVREDAHVNEEIEKYCMLMRDAVAESQKVDSETKAVGPFKEFLEEQQSW